MTPFSPLEKSVFLNAVELDSTVERAEFVKQACGGNISLYESVCKLLDEHDRQDNPIDSPIVGTVNTHSPHEPGNWIGNYKLREQIGEGGFGLVFVADQKQPVRRRVALKIIKPGMESREVLARFEAERQAIALMDHPNIAKVFDAGVTKTGQPFFAMELVKGVKLVDYCNQHRLGFKERLQLFISICHAVQHAHQKGIIHRDLKPSNILVAQQDGQPHPKVIDFGVAKAIGQSLTGETVYTRFTSMVGTPTYMSPEQAEMSSSDVDTRSDIYSLGVVLYELLTDSTPFAKERLHNVGFDELRRIIREEDPPKPSTRLSTLNNELESTLIGNRQDARQSIDRTMKGDLDWIVMKTIDKDRNRRYSTAGNLAADIVRFLNDQPVEARPPSSWYRFSKFAKRNKVGLTTAAMVTTAILFGLMISIWQTRIAIKERDQKVLALKHAKESEATANESKKDLEKFTERLNKSSILMSSARIHADNQRWVSAYNAFSEATVVQPKFFLVWLERGRLNAKLGRWQEASDDFSKAIEIGCPITTSELYGVPQLMLYARQIKDYHRICSELGVLDRSKDPFGSGMRGQLAGDFVDRELAEQYARLLESRIARTSSAASDRNRFLGMMHGVNLYIAGWAHLKSGNYSKALERLKESNEKKWFGRGIAHPLIAIAHHKSGHAELALQSLEDSKAYLDNWLDTCIQQSKSSPGIPWIDWVEFLLNHREATILVKGHTPVESPKMRRLERLSSLVIDN